MAMPAGHRPVSICGPCQAVGSSWSCHPPGLLAQPLPLREIGPTAESGDWGDGLSLNKWFVPGGMSPTLFFHFPAALLFFFHLVPN